MHQTDGQLAGDLILLEPRHGRKSTNTAIQTLVRMRRARFSHVAIALDSVVALHAMPSGGVQQIEISKLLEEMRKGHFAVLRNQALDQDAALQLAIRQHLLFHRGQKYNLAFNLRRRERASFCSELAAKAYLRLGLPLSVKSPRRVLPVDIEQLANVPGWIDVTSIYLQTLADESLISGDPELQRLLQGTSKLLREGARFQMEIEATLHESTREQQDALRLLNTIERVFQIPESELPGQIREYWDTVAKKKRQRSE